MKNIAVIIPTRSESRFVVQNGTRVFHCGVGMAECAAATARILCDVRPDLVILAGTAGTYTPDLVVGETVIVESETVADLGRRSGGEFTPLFQITYTAPISKVAGFKTVRSYTTSTAGGDITTPVEAEIENMEGAGFFALCDKMGVPAIEVRTVSNQVGNPIDGHNMEISIHRLALDLENIIGKMING